MSRSPQEKSPLLATLDDEEEEGDGIFHSEIDMKAKPISVFKKLGFAFGGPPNQLTHTLIGFELNFFLLQVVQVQPRVVGTIVLLGRVWDALMDPTVGVMTTRTRSRWGSLKPWLAGSVVPLALSYLAIWSVPPWWSSDSRALFVTIAYLMYQLCISMYYVPYTALTMHLSHIASDIDSATMYRMIAETLAVFVGALLTKILEPIANDAAKECEQNDNQSFCIYSPIQLGYMAQGGVVAALCILSGSGVLMSISEQKLPPGTSAPPDSFLNGIWTVVSTRSFRLLTMMFLWVWMGIAVIQTNFLLYAEIVLKQPFSVASDLLLTMLGVCVLSEPIWFTVMVKLGKKPTFILALFTTLPVIFSLYFLTGEAELWEMHLTFAALGLSIAAVYLVPAAMIPDVINEAALRDNGKRREALFYSYSVFFQKLGAGLAIFGSNEVLQQYGKYDSTAQNNDQAAGTIRILIGIVPASLVFVSIVVAFFYPLSTEDERMIKADLDRLRDGLQAEAKPEVAVKTNYYSGEGGFATDV